jgi:hypothetical protein
MKGFSGLGDLTRCVFLHVARDKGLGEGGRGAIRPDDSEEHQEDARNG